jgi:hypothetical protein
MVSEQWQTGNVPKQERYTSKLDFPERDKDLIQQVKSDIQSLQEQLTKEDSVDRAQITAEFSEILKFQTKELDGLKQKKDSLSNKSYSDTISEDEYNLNLHIIEEISNEWGRIKKSIDTIIDSITDKKH